MALLPGRSVYSTAGPAKARFTGASESPVKAKGVPENGKAPAQAHGANRVADVLEGTVGREEPLHTPARAACSTPSPRAASDRTFGGQSVRREPGRLARPAVIGLVPMYATAAPGPNRLQAQRIGPGPAVGAQLELGLAVRLPMIELRSLT